MENPTRQHGGRTWWVTLIALALEILLGWSTAAKKVEPETAAPVAAAIAAIAASHNLGRSYEDAARNKARGPNSTPPVI